MAYVGGSKHVVPEGGGDPGANTANHDFIFRLSSGTEFIRICDDGRCFVRGELVEENKAIWQAFKEWLAGARPSERSE